MPEPRLERLPGRESPVKIRAQTCLNIQAAEGQIVLCVNGIFFDVRVAGKREQTAARWSDRKAPARDRCWRRQSPAAVIPRKKFSFEKRVLNLHPGLEIIVMVDVRVIGLDAHIHQLPALAHGRRLIRERIAAGIVVHLVPADVGVYRDGGMRVQNADPAGRDVVTQISSR